MYTQNTDLQASDIAADTTDDVTADSSDDIAANSSDDVAADTSDDAANISGFATNVTDILQQQQPIAHLCG